jgi:signal transduction histidine kinase
MQLDLARKMKFKVEEAASLREMGYAYMNLGNYPRSLKILLSAIAILSDPQSEKNILLGNYFDDDSLISHDRTPRSQRLQGLALTEQMMGILFANSFDYERAIHHHWIALRAVDSAHNISLKSVVNLTMGRIYLALGKKDSALYRENEAYEGVQASGYKRYFGSILLNLGRVHEAMGDRALANEYYRKAIDTSARYYYYRGIVAANLLLNDYYKQVGKKDSGFLYVEEALRVAYQLKSPELLVRSYKAVADHYRAVNESDSAVKYQAMIIKINDSLFNSKQTQQFQNIDFDERQRLQELANEKEELKVRNRTYLMLTGLGAFLVLAIFLYRNNLSKQKTNKLLQSTLNNLRATQAQLIQSEKMASLGELTAGVAHEIQNPLNFVNNFSDLSLELLGEMKTEMQKGHTDEAMSISENVKENLEKILHHGRRADGIVKSMLQHSRTSTGQKETTDLNVLADEYLRLAYHGLRAKDKSFNADFKTDFEEDLPKVEIVPNDIGRVLVNLMNNAFYAVNEKRKVQPEGYVPTVTVSTRKHKGNVELTVKDNGIGVPQKLRDKIFQPFFTTKPTGQGTGLGLSLSYDILKAHGGDLKVNSVEGEGSEFAMILPG